MATILSGDIQIDYLDDNRQKRLSWIGSATGTRTMNEVYSACADLFDEGLQMDDGTVISAQTPVEYTIGSIDAGDNDPWYVSYDCMEHITGGALQTASWARVEASNTGIIAVAVTTGGAIVTADIGKDIVTDTDGDTGTLLEVITTGGALDYLIIRPDTSAAGNSFNNAPTAGDTMTCNAHQSTQSAAAVTGEQIWANFYTVTAIDSDTHIYAYQGTVSDTTRERVSAIGDSTQDWWAESTYDRVIFIRDYTTAAAPIIDGGYVTFFTRKGNTLYDSFELQASNTSGGRNPVPLSSSTDLNNTTGDRSVTFDGSGYVAGWTVGDEMNGTTSSARGIITQIDSAGASQTVHYYLIGDPQTTFIADEPVTNADDAGTGDLDGSNPATQGPALNTWFTNNAFPSIAHANTTYDTADEGTAEGYGITIDCNSNPLTEVYEWLKYITRNGSLDFANNDGIFGEQYEGCTVYLKYSGEVTGTIQEGSDVTQQTSGATGIVVSHDTVNKEFLLRNTRGTFATHAADETLTSNDSGAGTVEINTTATTFTPSKSSPYGTFAGGTFFGARGVVLTNWVSGDENSFQLTDSVGTVHVRPTAIEIEVTNLEGTDETTITDDRVAIFRLSGSGGDINKTEYSATGGEAIGDETITVDAGIAVDVPGKTTGGVLRIRDNDDNNQEYRLRYASWSSTVFTLDTLSPSSFSGNTTTEITRDAGDTFATAKRGDLVYNTTRSAVSYVVSVDSDNTITISPAITSQADGDTIELNTLPIALDTLDDVYVPLLDKYPTTTSASTSIVYSAQIYYRVVVRNVASSVQKIKPFTTNGDTSGTDKSIATIRTTDTIYT